jgi:hypothetical protein
MGDVWLMVDVIHDAEIAFACLIGLCGGKGAQDEECYRGLGGKGFYPRYVSFGASFATGFSRKIGIRTNLGRIIQRTRSGGGAHASQIWRRLHRN